MKTLTELQTEIKSKDLYIKSLKHDLELLNEDWYEKLKEELFWTKRQLEMENHTNIGLSCRVKYLSKTLEELMNSDKQHLKQLSNFDLSPRTLNALQMCKYRIYTTDDLIKLTETELESIKGLGKIWVMQVNTLLFKLNLKLKSN